MNAVLERIAQTRLVPVIKIEDAGQAVELGNALIAGGLPIAEVTFRTDAAADAIARMKSECDGLLIGAGTVLTPEQVDRAIAAGAEFIVSPGFNPRVVDHCLKLDVPITPGVNSPTQIEMGLERGLEVLKFFPAEASGGVAMLKAVSAPYGDVRFIPTGGISPSNLISYLSLSCVLACGGSWMVKSDLISTGDFDEITRLCREATELAGSA